MIATLAMVPAAAGAQTADYFATPWIVAPINSQLSETGAAAPSSSESPTSQPSPQETGSTPANSSRSNLYTQALASSEPSAPPVLYVFNAGIDELATDNVAQTETNRIPDLSSIFSAGLSLTADTPRVTGALAATGIYRKNVNDTELDEFSEYAYGNGQTVILPGNLYFSAYGLIDDLSTAGGGIQNPLLQSGLNTHSYTLAGSPYWVNRFGDLALNVLRYQIGQAWFDNPSPTGGGFNSSDLTASTDQSLRDDIKMAGTILPRLMTDFSLSGTQDDSGNSEAGVLKTATGEAISEYEMTRWAGVIGGAGYEILRDSDVFGVNGEGPVWDIGGRIRPNADSSFLLVYGRHSLKTDFAGEFAWRLTPYTDLYASYTDSFSTAQQSVISNTADSVLGPVGAVTDVGYNESTIIGVLNDQALNETPGGDIIPLGVPLSTIENVTPLQNGLFRDKVLSGTARSVLANDPILLTAYQVQQISLTPFLVPSTTAEGGTVSWSPILSERLSGLSQVGYTRLTGAEHADAYNAAIGAQYNLSESITVIARYDFILRKAVPSTGGYLENAVTIALHKSFD